MSTGGGNRKMVALSLKRQKKVGVQVDARWWVNFTGKYGRGCYGGCNVEEGGSCMFFYLVLATSLAGWISGIPVLDFYASAATWFLLKHSCEDLNHEPRFVFSFPYFVAPIQYHFFLVQMSKLYVVYVRHEPGINNSWDECKSQVQGVSNVVHCSFYSSYDAITTFEAFVEEINWLEGKLILPCESYGKKQNLMVSNKRKTIGKHYYFCIGCGDMTYVKYLREKKCSSGLGMGSPSSSSTIILALAERCEALEAKVQTFTQQRDACGERAKMLVDALNDIKNLKLGE
ncbi:hypothetical protein Pint_16536 [Pistacia integerrima]|uniref:Uncharacterized protein n=1 Tax=Pistacia integerrima TaxID=434235 RepID=A0ACC0ZB38_9ROSI|nr:hypothetical protein Pint_16536 [Pistacia integerrima]